MNLYEVIIIYTFNKLRSIFNNNPNIILTYNVTPESNYICIEGFINQNSAMADMQLHAYLKPTYREYKLSVSEQPYSIYISNIRINNDSYKRKGYGTLMLKYLQNIIGPLNDIFSKYNNCDYIITEISGIISTDLGSSYNCLYKFYKKNGFSISDKIFFYKKI